ncbi:HNH endonuclease [Dechloromonas sp. H13]|uniref:HNH endonuclease n=1 Tax=Dechloromonas sp. H13 TaxID=2570193 RepID=UPI001D17F413|nr:HNH endonuclease [Dechloromonas sp. H13]
MSSEYETQLREAFAGLGGYSKLANGFRLQVPTGQTCAVYFSSNAPGNAVEIGLSPKALAPILGRPESDIRDWVTSQAAVTGRERVVSGARGSYPGLALGSRRELDAFLMAWREFVSKPGGGSLAATRVEKAAEDAGFDLTPAREGQWMIFRSSAFPLVLGVVLRSVETYRVGFSDAGWGHKVAYDCSVDVRDEDGPWAAIVESLAGYDALYALVLRAGRVAHLLAGEGAGQFAGEVQRLPSTTEAERLVVQRVGQDIFRQSLIDYWQGRCAVTALDVVPLLRASHIKPWARCETDAERLDVFNGLLLAPHLDALFDGGWISFDDDGGMLVCIDLSGEQRALLGLAATWRLRELTTAHRRYLAWHRSNLFLT